MQVATRSRRHVGAWARRLFSSLRPPFSGARVWRAAVSIRREVSARLSIHELAAGYTGGAGHIWRARASGHTGHRPSRRVTCRTRRSSR